MLSTGGGEPCRVPEACARVNELYRRYVREGPYVAWATHFGRQCPDPDFAGAAHLARVLPLRQARHFAGRHRRILALGGTAALALALAVWAAQRRRIGS